MASFLKNKSAGKILISPLIIAPVVAIILYIGWFDLQYFWPDAADFILLRSSYSDVGGRPDIVAISNDKWPGTAADNCVPDQMCHLDVATVRCSFHNIPDASEDPLDNLHLCTTDFQAPVDLCNRNFECRVINGQCKTVVNTKGYGECMSCWRRCENNNDAVNNTLCLNQC